MQVIIFRQADDTVAVMFPTPEFADRMQELGEKDVPTGMPWRIIDDADLPTEPQSSWVWTESGSLGISENPSVPLVQSAQSISFAQLLIGLVAEGWITQEEGEAWLKGTLPPSVLATINLIPVEQQFAAKVRATSPSVVLRNDPLVEMMALAQGRTAAELDAFFTTYSAV